MIDLGQIILSALPGRSRYHYDFVVRPMTKLNENKELYNGKIVYRKDILWFIKAQNTLISGSNYQPRGILPIDKYGGGKFKFPKIALPKFIKGDFNTNYFSFVPTPSALDYKKGNKILTEEDYQKSFSPVDDINDTPFANFVAERVVNSEEFDHENKNNNFHINFSDRDGQFIINQLSEDPVLQDKKLTASYLCGSKIKIGGEDIQCENKNAVYTTGFAPYIYIGQ